MPVVAAVKVVGVWEKGNVASFITFLSFLLLNYLFHLRGSKRKPSLSLS
jgi:hypothetical protein